MEAYFYETDLCTWVIRQHRSPDHLPWELCWSYHLRRWQRTGYYATPALAATDVAEQETGFSKWDALKTGSLPAGIEHVRKWQRVAPSI